MSKQFSDLGINRELQARLKDIDIVEPTEVQKKVIPFILQRKKDLVALAKTGTGKTAAFGLLPLLQLINPKKNTIQVIILASTRELGQQIHANLNLYASYNPEISVIGLFGGTTIKSQLEVLKRTVHIVVATPGRLLDLIDRKSIDVSTTSYLVLDEADEMVDALHAEVENIFKEVPKTSRILMFTATMPGRIKQLVQNYLSKNATTIEADMHSIGHQGIIHQYTIVDPIEKLDILLHFLYAREGQQGIIFCKTKAAVNKLGKNLAKNKFSSGTIHGSLTQGIRDRVMGQFREGHIKVLIATDLAARGIDVKNVSYVVNYHLPDTYETYVHRSGRTARAGSKGLSLTILQKEEVKDIAGFENELGIKFKEVKKADSGSIEENNTLLWARKIFKTKPNRTVTDDFKSKIKTIFHHLTKEELIEKVLANHLNYLEQTNKGKQNK
ncbi:DEAD/DEAH box helicase [Flavobacteriaceae bacterium]|nr:DEAD/DEAH box helicase [Flavobacteriaceae bacterium]